MAYYDLSKEERNQKIAIMTVSIQQAVTSGHLQQVTVFCAEEDMYIRKNAYLILARLFR